MATTPPQPLTPPRPHVVIVGGGFGGLAVARALRGAPVDVTLVDRRNHHLFQPLLYQVATGGLSPANIAVPLRRILRKHENVRVLLAEVRDVDLEAREVVLDHRRLGYDHLVVAAGATNQWFGNDDWEQHAPGLKSVADATAIRARILRAFEHAELLGARGAPQGVALRRWLTFVIIGAGPTGVEMAGAIAELARDTLRQDFRSIDTTQTRIVLVEGASQVLPVYPSGLAAKAQRELERQGVTVRTSTLVTAVDAEGITVRTATAPGEPEAVEERIDARTVIWAAGVRAVPLAARVAAAAGVEVDRGGRVPVGTDLTLPGHPEVSVIGDMAAAPGTDGRPLPGLAPVAMQGGEYAAAAILARLSGRQAAPFRFKDQGSMATVGRGFAVFQRGRIRVTGFLGWLGWLFIHLLQLVEMENRLLVVTQWAWSYLTRNRSARLIVDEADGREEREG
ncbi:MAG: NAD(P)/FAD-dependent oxidoreductase [Dehalococcoidia bacterium]|nr:NAD(P)/FAD-dependent oxidoreductase [Dehalococcoidia bacterium]